MPDSSRQHLLAIYRAALATVLARDSRCTLLCAGTDGSDGPGEDAGEALRRADSGRFLRASGDLLRTGPTGTNVMDVVLGIKDVH